jgi:ABC-2 type transport system permease protein
MRTIHLAAKDLSQLLRDRRSLLFLLLMPIAFTVFMGFAFGRSGNPAEALPILGLRNADGGGLVARGLEAALKASGAIRVQSMAPGQEHDPRASGKMAGFLSIPAGFSSSALAGGEVRLVLEADPSSAATQAIYQVVRTALVRELSAARPAIVERELAGPAASPAVAEDASLSFAIASSLWDEADARGLPIREEKAVRGRAGGMPANPNDQSSPGMLVMFTIFGLTSSAGILVQERKSGTLRRLRATAMSPIAILGGHFLAMAAVVFAQAAILVVFGQLVLGVNYAREPLAILAVLLGLSFCIAGAGLLIGCLARKEEQSTLYSLAAMFVLSALGGAWFPIEGTGKFFSALSKLTPSSWAMTGLQNIVVRGQGLESALLPSLVLGLFALAFVAVAALRFRSE